MLSAGDAGLLGDTAARLLGRERRLGLVSAPWRTSRQYSNRASFRRQGERWHIFAKCMTEDGPYLSWRSGGPYPCGRGGELGS